MPLSTVIFLMIIKKKSITKLMIIKLMMGISTVINSMMMSHHEKHIFDPQKQGSEEFND